MLDRKSCNKDVIQKQAESTDAIVGKLDNKKVGSKESNNGTIIPGVPNWGTVLVGVDLLTLVGFGGYKLGKKFDIFGKGNVKGSNPFGNKDVIIEEEDNNVLGNLNIGM